MKKSQLKQIIKEELKREMRESKGLLLEKKTCQCDATHQITNVPDNVTCTVACGTIWPDIEFNPPEMTTGGGGSGEPTLIDFKTGQRVAANTGGGIRGDRLDRDEIREKKKCPKGQTWMSTYPYGGHGFCSVHLPTVTITGQTATPTNPTGIKFPYNQADNNLGNSVRENKNNKMAKQNITERFQQLAGIKVLH